MFRLSIYLLSLGSSTLIPLFNMEGSSIHIYVDVSSLSPAGTAGGAFFTMDLVPLALLRA